MIEAIRSGAIDKVLVWSLCRVGRSLTELVGFLETCRARGVALYLHEQQIDTATSNGVSLLDVAPLMVHHLRQSRRSKILRGQAAARALSIRFGRPRDLDNQVAASQTRTGRWQGRATGCPNGRNFPGIGLKNQNFNERRGRHNLTLEQQNTSGYE